MGKRTAQKDTITDITDDSQVNSNFPYRWSPASLTFNNYFYLFLYLYIMWTTINNNAPHLKSPKNQNRRAALGRPAVKITGGLQLVCGRPTLSLSGSNSPCLKQIFIVPKVFEPLKFDCRWTNHGITVIHHPHQTLLFMKYFMLKFSFSGKGRIRYSWLVKASLVLCFACDLQKQDIGITFSVSSSAA